jgi:hypothetical protein
MNEEIKNYIDQQIREHVHNGILSKRIIATDIDKLYIYKGVGAPAFNAQQGSLYLRTDGSSTSTRAYINTNGAATWTAITTAT